MTVQEQTFCLSTYNCNYYVGKITATAPSQFFHSIKFRNRATGRLSLDVRFKKHFQDYFFQLLPIFIALDSIALRHYVFSCIVLGSGGSRGGARARDP